MILLADWNSFVYKLNLIDFLYRNPVHVEVHFLGKTTRFVISSVELQALL
jgi:hypothetical protein